MLCYMIFSPPFTQKQISYISLFGVNDYKCCPQSLGHFFGFGPQAKFWFGDGLFTIRRQSSIYTCMACMAMVDSIAVSLFVDWMSLSNQKQIQITI